MEAPSPVPAPSPPPRFEPAELETKQRSVSGQHVCRFYENDDFLCAEVARYVVEGLSAGQPILLVMTEAHRATLERQLGEHGVSFSKAQRKGQIAFYDAEAALASFMVGDHPDPERFKQAVEGAFGRVWPGKPGTQLRIFGEMVDVLWRAGNANAALRLEDYWNGLAQDADFELLCGYSLNNFYGVANAEHFRAVCAQHARAIPTESIDTDGHRIARDLEISLLQQRARSLEGERAQRHELEAALRQAVEDRSGAERALLDARGQADEAARVKSDFLALMSHELRTPLNAILGYQDLLEHGVGGQLSAEQRAYLSRMRSCSHQLLRLIDQLLTLSRPEGNPIDLRQEVVDALQLARDTAAMVEPGAQRRGLHLDVGRPTAEIPLVTDAGTLRQILLNLLTNATKFTEEGGIRLSLARRGDHAIFEVADTGIGIRAEDLDRIFEPFVQVENPANRRFGGSGLGLALSRDLAHLLGGSLKVRSEVGSGSTFTLSLPLNRTVSA